MKWNETKVNYLFIVVHIPSQGGVGASFLVNPSLHLSAH